MTLLYLSPVPWDSYEQRPHYFVRDFLEQGGSVVWVNPYPGRLPNWRDLMRISTRRTTLTVARPDRLTVVDTGGLPVDPLPGGRQLNARLFWKDAITRLRSVATGRDTVVGIGRPTGLALTLLSELSPRRAFYDAMDDFPEFYRGRSREATRKIESDIVRHVTRVVVSSSGLEKKFAAIGAPVTLMRNAYDMSLLPAYRARQAADPHFGFIGCLGRWFDWGAVRTLAEVVLPAPVTLIGPVAVPAPARLPSNVTIHPACSQAEGVGWLQRFTAGLIPFVQDPLTAGVDPIKFYQYRGAGLPVLSTRFGEMATRGAGEGTFFLDGAMGDGAAIAAAGGHRPTPAEVDTFREHNTWTRRFRDSALWASV